MATLDGQVGVAMTQGDTTVIQASDYRTRLIRFPRKPLLRSVAGKAEMGARINGLRGDIIYALLVQYI